MSFEGQGGAEIKYIFVLCFVLVLFFLSIADNLILFFNNLKNKIKKKHNKGGLI